MPLIYNEDGSWSNEFLKSERYLTFRAAVNACFADFEGDIRQLSHAMASEVWFQEVRHFARRSFERKGVQIALDL